MIIQFLLDVLVNHMVSFIDVIPPAPPLVMQSVSAVISFGDSLSHYADPLGVIIPWDAVNIGLSMLVATIPLFGTFVAIRIIAWLVNR